MQRVEKLVYKLVDQLEKKNSPQTLLFTAQLLVMELLRQPVFSDDEISSLLEPSNTSEPLDSILPTQKDLEENKELKVGDWMPDKEPRENILGVIKTKIELEEPNTIPNTILGFNDNALELQTVTETEIVNKAVETYTNEAYYEDIEKQNSILTVKEEIIEQEAKPIADEEIDNKEPIINIQTIAQENSQPYEEKITFDPYVFIYSDEDEAIKPVINNDQPTTDTPSIQSNTEIFLEEQGEKTKNNDSQKDLSITPEENDEDDWLTLNNIHYLEKKSHELSRFTQKVQELPLYPIEPAIQDPIPNFNELLNFEPYQDFSEKVQDLDDANNKVTTIIPNQSPTPKDYLEEITAEPIIDIPNENVIGENVKIEEKPFSNEKQEPVKESQFSSFQPFIDYLPKEFKNNLNPKGDTTPFLDDNFIKSPSFLSAFTNQSSPIYPSAQKLESTESSIHEKISKLETQVSNEKRVLNDDKKEHSKEVVEVFRETPLKDLRKAFGINDRYLFTFGLFNGDDRIFDKSIKTINTFNNLSEAEEWMKGELVKKYGWDEKSETVKHFYQLVKRRFS